MFLYGWLRLAAALGAVVCAREKPSKHSVMQTLTATSKNATNIGVKIDNFYRFNGSLTEPPCTEVPSCLPPRISGPLQGCYANGVCIFGHYLSERCTCVCASVARLSRVAMHHVSGALRPHTLRAGATLASHYCPTD